MTRQGGMVFYATYEPRSSGALDPAQRAWVGRRCAWRCEWRIPGGPLANEWACTPLDTTAPFRWVPEGDLCEADTETAA